jgi:hypothetical protein
MTTAKKVAPKAKDGKAAKVPTATEHACSNREQSRDTSRS